MEINEPLINTLTKSEMKNILKYVWLNDFTVKYAFEVVLEQRRKFPN